MDKGEIISIRDKKALGATFLITVCASIILFFYAIHAALPTNPVTLPFESKINMIKWFPQGWGFFSKDPREEQFFAYDMKTGNSVFTFPNNRPENFFGLRRYGRAQGIEYGRIYSNIPPSAWSTCKKDPMDCLNQLEKSIEVKNDIPNPTICGEVGVVNKKLVPWAWSKSRENIKMPSKVVRVNVLCSKR